MGERAGNRCECTRKTCGHDGRCNKRLRTGYWNAHHRVAIKSGGAVARWTSRFEVFVRKRGAGPERLAGIRPVIRHWSSTLQPAPRTARGFDDRELPPILDELGANLGYPLINQPFPAASSSQIFPIEVASLGFRQVGEMCQGNLKALALNCLTNAS